MSNKFLTRQTAGLDDGTADLYVGSIRLNNINVSKNLKTDAIGQLVAGDVSISEVDGLQTQLDFKLNKTVATFLTQPSTPTTPPIGDFKLYAKDDKKLYTLNSDGIETEISLGSNPFNQTLNTSSSVEFASVKDNQHNLTLGLNLTPLTSCVQLGGNTVAPTRGTGCTVVGFDAARNVGQSNTVVGNAALFLAASSGDNNVVMGSRIGVGGVIGSDNTILGDFTVFSGCGNNNVAVGKNIAFASPLVNNILAINASSSALDPVGSNKIVLRGGTSTFTVDAFGAVVNGTAVQIPNQNVSTTSSPSFVDLSHTGNMYFNNLNNNLVYHQQGMTFTGTGTNNISIGFKTTQPNLNSAFNTVSIGFDAGLSSTTESVAVGWECGKTAQGLFATAVGSGAGKVNQSQGGAAFGHQAGQTNQGIRATAIGDLAGQSGQGANAIALGTGAGKLNQGSDSICIGNDAGSTFSDSIIIKAKTTTISNATASNQYNIIAGTTTLIGDTTSMRPNTNIDVGSNFVLTTGVPTLNAHLTNKLYVDTGLNTKLNLSGGTMTGNITTLRTNDSKIILGSNAGLLASGNNSVCIGSSSNSTGQDTVALGISSLASNGSCVAIGNTATASALGSIAIGVNAVASSQGVALGREAKVLNDSSIIINANAGTVLQSTANNQIQMTAGTTQFVYDSAGFVIANTTASTSTTTGSLQCKGGLGVLGAANIGGNMNVPTLNNRTPSTGFFYQTGNLDITIATTNVETEITSDTGVGSRTFTVAEMYTGAAFGITLGGTLNTSNKENLQIRFYLDDPALVLPTILFFDSGAMEISDMAGVNNQFKFLAEFSLRVSGASSTIYSNNQLLYARDVLENSFRGQSKWQLATGANLSVPRKFRATIMWTTALGVHNFINRLVRINRVY
jgi:trimeric autotransporter adhesin